MCVSVDNRAGAVQLPICSIQCFGHQPAPAIACHASTKQPEVKPSYPGIAMLAMDHNLMYNKIQHHCLLLLKPGV